MARLALAAVAVLLLAVTASCGPVTHDVAKKTAVGAGPAVVPIAIGQTKNFTIERGVITKFAVDLTRLTNVTYFEAFLQSTTSSQCSFQWQINGGPVYSGSFPPSLITLSNYYQWNYSNPTNNTLLINETMGLCGASFTVRMSPLVELVPKAGLQAVNVELLINGYLRLAIGAPGESLAPFAINITAPGTASNVVLYNSGGSCYFGALSSGVANCMLDTNRIPYSQYGGSGQNITGPWTYLLSVTSQFGNAQFVSVNVSYVPETPVALQVGGPAFLLAIDPLLSYLFTVPLSRTLSRNITIAAASSASMLIYTYTYSAGDYALVGSGPIGANYNSYGYNTSVSVILPPQRPAATWTFVFALNPSNSRVPFPVTIIVA